MVYFIFSRNIAICGEELGQVKFDAQAIIDQGNKPEAITELDRLSYMVDLIDYECAVVPQNAYRITPSDEVRANGSYRGLCKDELDKLDNYRHFRMPSNDTKIDLLCT